jgi:hypothetical protein
MSHSLRSQACSSKHGAMQSAFAGSGRSCIDRVAYRGFLSFSSHVQSKASARVNTFQFQKLFAAGRVVAMTSFRDGISNSCVQCV